MTDVRVTWSGRRAVVTFPEHVDVSNAAQIGEHMLAALGSGAVTLIADMSATAWCDHAGVDLVIRAYQRAVASQAELRLVICAPDVLRLMSAEGLDRLVAVHVSVEAALAAGRPDGPAAGNPAAWPVSAPRCPAGLEAEGDHGGGPPSPMHDAVLRQVVDALDDGVALTGDDGMIVLANRRLAVMFGYPPAELTGQLVETLIPAGLRETHRRERAAYALKPVARPMADRARLVGVRKDGGTVPVTITLAPVTTANGHLVLAVVKDATQAQLRDDLAVMLSAAAVQEAFDWRELLDLVVGRLFQVGLSLQAAEELPAEVARERISEALRLLDDTIHEIRDHIFRSQWPGAAQLRGLRSALAHLPAC